MTFPFKLQKKPLKIYTILEEHFFFSAGAATTLRAVRHFFSSVTMQRRRMWTNTPHDQMRLCELGGALRTPTNGGVWKKNGFSYDGDKNGERLPRGPPSISRRHPSALR